MKLADRIIELRHKRGMTQDQLAEALGIARSSLANYESPYNERLPRRRRLQEIADFFKVSVAYLIGDTDDPTDMIEPNIDDSKAMEENELTLAEEALMKELELPIEKIAEKFNLTIDGQRASHEELEYMIEQIRTFRKFHKK